MNRKKKWIIALCALAMICAFILLALIRNDKREAPREIELFPAPALTPRITPQAAQ